MGLPQITEYSLPLVTELPIARAKWVPDFKRSALLIHDMQGYFVDAFDRKTSPILPVIENCLTMRTLCRSLDIPIFYTAQQGNQKPHDRGLQADLWGPGMTTSPQHKNIIEDLTPGAEDFVITKHRYSAFQRNNFYELMHTRSRDQLIICGIYAHIGCLLTAAEAFQKDIQPFLIVDATADFSRKNHDMAIDYVANCCGVPMTTLQTCADLSDAAP